MDVVANLPIASAGTATIEDESFNGVDMGTETSPAYHTMQGDLNAYTRYPDWYGVTLMLAEGKVGMKNYAAAMGVYSMLYTPVYQVSGTPGTVKLSLTVDAVSCSAQTELGVVMVEITETGETPVGDWQFATLTGTGKQLDFTLGACGSYYIAIGFDDPADPYGTNAVVYIDQLRVTQELEAGAVLSRLSHMETAYNPSLHVAVPEELRAASFYYYVYGVSFGAGGRFYSAPLGHHASAAAHEGRKHRGRRASPVRRTGTAYRGGRCGKRSSHLRCIGTRRASRPARTGSKHIRLATRLVLRAEWRGHLQGLVAVGAGVSNRLVEPQRAQRAQRQKMPLRFFALFAVHLLPLCCSFTPLCRTWHFLIAGRCFTVYPQSVIRPFVNIFACFPSCDGVFATFPLDIARYAFGKKPPKTARHKNRNQAKPNDRFGLKVEGKTGRHTG